MEFNTDSLITSIIFFNIFILIVSLIRKNNRFIKNFSIYPIFLFSLLAIFRGLFSFETDLTFHIYSKRILGHFYEALGIPILDNGFELHIHDLLIFIWIIGSLYFLIKNTRIYKAVKNYLEVSPFKENPEYNKLAKNILKEKNIDREIKVYVSDRITIPFMMGVKSGKIYIPDMNFTEKEIEYILKHEINHFIHYDNLQKYFIEILKIMFWWNPIINPFSKDFENILEIQSDLNSTKNLETKEKLVYLRTITKVIENNLKEKEKRLKNPVYSYLVGTREKDYLKQRFLIVLQYKREKVNKTISRILSSLAVVVFLLSYLVVFKPIYVSHEEGLHTAKEIKNLLGEEVEKNEDFLLKREDGRYDVYINYTYEKAIKEIEEKYAKFPVYNYRIDG